MNRRRFTFAAAALLSGLGAWLWRREGRAAAAKDPARSATAAPPPRDAAARAIAEHLPYLQVSDEEVARFRRACRDNGVELESERKKRIARLFLLSSDFFANGENVERPVRFVTLFGPYSSPCYQPLMHMKT